MKETLQSIVDQSGALGAIIVDQARHVVEVVSNRVGELSEESAAEVASQVGEFGPAGSAEEEEFSIVWDQGERLNFHYRDISGGFGVVIVFSARSELASVRMTVKKHLEELTAGALQL